MKESFNTSALKTNIINMANEIVNQKTTVSLFANYHVNLNEKVQNAFPKTSLEVYHTYRIFDVDTYLFDISHIQTPTQNDFYLSTYVMIGSEDNFIPMISDRFNKETRESFKNNIAPDGAPDDYIKLRKLFFDARRASEEKDLRKLHAAKALLMRHKR